MKERAFRAMYDSDSDRILYKPTKTFFVFPMEFAKICIFGGNILRFRQKNVKMIQYVQF